MNTGVATGGLSADESGNFHLVCRLFDLHWSDFEVHVEHEYEGGPGRKGRKLAHVLNRMSGRHRSYRAGTGNDWLTAFEEDVKAHCFTSLFHRQAAMASRTHGMHAGARKSPNRRTKSKENA